jgi:hypothetical protein
MDTKCSRIPSMKKFLNWASVRKMVKPEFLVKSEDLVGYRILELKDKR